MLVPIFWTHTQEKYKNALYVYETFYGNNVIACEVTRQQNFVPDVQSRPCLYGTGLAPSAL